MSNPVHVMVQRQPQVLSIVPDAAHLKNSLERLAGTEHAALNADSQETNTLNHGGAQLPGTTATPGFNIPAPSVGEKRLVTAYNNTLHAFYNNKITGDMLASNKALALQLEQALQWEQRFFQLMSNIAKLQHETMQGIIGNLRG